MNYLEYEDFIKIDIRVGTIIEAELSNGLKNPSMILKIDFGKDIGIKKSSAQILDHYRSHLLINKQVAAVINFLPKQIGKIISEVLVLGFSDINNKTVLFSPDLKIKNGGKLY